MKALNLFNALTMALMASFALTLGAVSVLYAFHLDAAPRMRSEWYMVLKLTLVFCLLTAMSAWAFLSHWRRLRWRWPAEAALVLTLAGGAAWIVDLLG